MLQQLRTQRAEAEDVRKSMGERVAAAGWRGSSGSGFGRGAIRCRRRSESRDGMQTGLCGSGSSCSVIRC